MPSDTSMIHCYACMTCDTICEADIRVTNACSTVFEGLYQMLHGSSGSNIVNGPCCLFSYGKPPNFDHIKRYISRICLGAPRAKNNLLASSVLLLCIAS